MAATDFRAIISSGDEDRLVIFLHSKEFEQNPKEWFPYDESPLMVAFLFPHALEHIIDRLHGLGVLEEICTSHIRMPSTYFDDVKFQGMVPLHAVVKIKRYNAIPSLLKYPECWKATYIASTEGETAISTCISWCCVGFASSHSQADDNLLEILLSTENPYLSECIKVYEEPEINPIDSIFAILEGITIIGLHSDPDAVKRCKKLYELQRSKNGSLTKKATTG